MAKGKPRAYKSTGTNVVKIFKVLSKAAAEGEEFLTVSEIARRAAMHKWTVSRTIDLYMDSIVDVVQPPELEAVGLRVKLVKLNNPGLTLRQVISYLKMRRKIIS